MKYYVKCGQYERIVLADTPIAAAVKCVSAWKDKKRRMEISMRVSQVGFDARSGHPDHVKDEIVATSAAKKKIK